MSERRGCHRDHHVAGCLHGLLAGDVTQLGLPPVSPSPTGIWTSRTYAVSLPRWASRIRSAAEAVARWTKRFETYTRIG